jgi:hypothetical protein
MPLFNAVDVVAQPVTRPPDGLAWPGEAREASGSQWNALHAQPGAASAMDQDGRTSSRKRSAEAMMISAAPQHAASVGTAKTPKSPITVTLYCKCTRALTSENFFRADEHCSKRAHVGCVATRAAL